MKLHSFRWLMLTGLLTGSLAHANHHEKGEAMHGDRMPHMFSQFDKNKDGRVSREEAREGMDRLFTEADTNKDGFISTEEEETDSERVCRLANDMESSINIRLGRSGVRWAGD